MRFGSHTLLSLYLRSVTLPFEIRAIAPSYFNDYAVRSFSRGSFHLYISLPPYYTERVLKASSIWVEAEQARVESIINSFSL